MAIAWSPKAGRFTTRRLESSDSKHGERTLGKEVAIHKPAQGSLGESPQGLALFLFWQGC